MQERKIENTKKIKYILFGILLIVAVLGVLAAKTIFEKPRSIAEYQMEIHVVTNQNEVGVDSGPEKLNFGWVGPGFATIRYIDIGNPQQDAKVKLVVSGDFASWVHLSENNFVIKTGEKKEIAIKTTVPSNAQPGNHTANLRVEFYNTNFG
jgi:uncharacterized membrane protein